MDLGGKGLLLYPAPRFCLVCAEPVPSLGGRSNAIPGFVLARIVFIKMQI